MSNPYGTVQKPAVLSRNKGRAGVKKSPTQSRSSKKTSSSKDKKATRSRGGMGCGSMM